LCVSLWCSYYVSTCVWRVFNKLMMMMMMMMMMMIEILFQIACFKSFPTFWLCTCVQIKQNECVARTIQLTSYDDWSASTERRRHTWVGLPDYSVSKVSSQRDHPARPRSRVPRRTPLPHQGQSAVAVASLLDTIEIDHGGARITNESACGLTCNGNGNVGFSR